MTNNVGKISGGGKKSASVVEAKPDPATVRVETTRFGVVAIAAERVLHFPAGLLGFPDKQRFCLLEPEGGSLFFWLQSMEDPALAFVVTDPTMFVADYAVPIRPEQMAAMMLTKLDEAQVFVIVNKVDDSLTGNLQGPLVVNTRTRTGEQFVLAEKRWNTRQKLASLEETGTRSRAAAMSA